jgi:hypothetical protein
VLDKPERPEDDSSLVAVRFNRLSHGYRHSVPLTRFDYALIGVLLLFLFPAFKIARLPLRFAFADLAGAYWGGSAVHSVFVAVLLAVAGLPLRQTVMPVLRRYREKKFLVLLPIAVAALMFPLLGWELGIVVTVDAIVVAELMVQKQQMFEPMLADVFVPATYLFFGLILVFAFNHAIAGIRFVGTYDVVLNHWDWILFHSNVSNIAQWSFTHLPQWYITLEEAIYFGLFSGIGAAFVLAALLGGRRYAVLYVRTLLVCYSMAIVIFLAMPGKGPYSVIPIHISNVLPSSLTSMTLLTQEILAARVRLLWAHHLIPLVSSVNLGDYYISFPSLHAALPIISIWFLRPWKRIAWIASGIYGLLLLPSLILLDWHYIVDLLGGFAVASLSILLVESISRAGRDGCPEVSASSKD